MPEPCSLRPVLGTAALSCIEQKIGRKLPQKKKKKTKEKYICYKADNNNSGEYFMLG